MEAQQADAQASHARTAQRMTAAVLATALEADAESRRRLRADRAEEAAEDATVAATAAEQEPTSVALHLLPEQFRVSLLGIVACSLLWQGRRDQDVAWALTLLQRFAWAYLKLPAGAPGRLHEHRQRQPADARVQTWYARSRRCSPSPTLRSNVAPTPS